MDIRVLSHGVSCSKPETRELELDELDRRLLNDFQHGFPLSPSPYAELARRLGTTEEEVLGRIQALKEAGAVSRVGAVVRPRTVGASTLAAMSVPAERLEEVAELVNGYPEVNHNYEREHEMNLWFVITAANDNRLQEVLREIEAETSLPAHSFPLQEDYHIDLGFDLRRV